MIVADWGRIPMADRKPRPSLVVWVAGRRNGGVNPENSGYAAPLGSGNDSGRRRQDGGEKKPVLGLVHFEITDAVVCAMDPVKRPADL